MLIFMLLFMNTSSAFKALVVMIALLGLDAETGIFMLIFLDLSHDEAKKRGRLNNTADLDEAIIHGAVKRARPKMMTMAAAFMGLLSIMWSTSAGADVMKRIAAPPFGWILKEGGTASLPRLLDGSSRRAGLLRCPAFWMDP